LAAALGLSTDGVAFDCVAAKETSVFVAEVLEGRLGFGDEEGAEGTQRGIHG